MSIARVITLTRGEELLLETLDGLGGCGTGAAAFVRNSGLPGRRLEGWRWSDLRGAVDASTKIISRRNHISSAAAGMLSETKATQTPIITALASALSSDDSDDLEVDGLYERVGQANRVVTVTGGQKILVERISAQSGLSAGSLKALVDGGTFTRVLIQDGADDAIVLNRAEVTVAPGGRYEQFVLIFGGKFTRIETKVSLWDGGELVLNGAYLSASGSHGDLTSEVVAEGPGRNEPARGSTCEQIARGVARAGGRGVFQGKILVQKGAQKTNARQNHQALMLEDGAEIFSKPELQIFADDVQCAHGNAIGAIDRDALFYMRSRGIPEIEARAMLIQAFLAQAIPGSLVGALRQEIIDRMDAWLVGASV